MPALDWSRTVRSLGGQCIRLLKWRAVAVSWLVLHLCAAVPAANAGPQYELYPSGSGASVTSTIRLTVAPQSRATLTLVQSAARVDTLNLVLSSFADSTGKVIDMSVGVPSEPEREPAARLEGVVVDQLVFPLELHIPGLQGPGPYSGVLFLDRGDSVVARFAIELRRTPARVVLDRHAIRLQQTRGILGWRASPEFSVRVWEASGEWPLADLFARFRGEVEASRFDPQRQITFVIGGDTIVDFWTTPVADSAASEARRVEAGGQAVIRGAVGALPPGEYKTTLRFGATNAVESGEQQELSLTLQVRDHILRAIAVLILAIAFSYFATKWLAVRRRRLDFLDRQKRLRPGWLAHEPNNLTVVSVRAIFRQARDLAGKPFLAGFDTVEERVKNVVELLDPLGRIRRLRANIESLKWAPMVKRRAEKELRSVVAILERAGAGPLDQKTATDLDTAVGKLEEWFEPTKLDSCYGNSLKRDVRVLLGQIDLKAISDPLQEKVVAELATELVQAAPPALNDMMERERSYSKLKILWERRNEEEFGELVSACARGDAVERIFELADRAAWIRLKAAVDAKKIGFVAPRPSPDPFQAYQPLQFEIAPDDLSVRENYLFKHKLRYEWGLTLNAPKHDLFGRARGPDRAVVELRPVTEGPRVVQYAPEPGKLQVRVRAMFGDEVLELAQMDEPLTIETSDDFAQLRAFSHAELAAVAAAAVVALLTGLKMFYVDNAVFGSIQDYLALFLWGVGADQTKNFVQQLPVYGASQTQSAAET